jgi:hypothetical protein
MQTEIETTVFFSSDLEKALMATIDGPASVSEPSNKISLFIN